VGHRNHEETSFPFLLAASSNAHLHPSYRTEFVCPSLLNRLKTHARHQKQNERALAKHPCTSARTSLELASVITVFSSFPSAMDAGAYTRSYTSLPSESSSGHSADDVVIGPSSEMDPPLPQEPFLEDEGTEINHWLRDVPLNARGPQVNAEVRFIVGCDTRTSNQLTTTDIQPYRSDRYPSVRHTLVRGIDGRLDGTPHHEEDLPVTQPLDSIHLATAFPRLPQV
jgi:hypothetical protein